MVTILYGPHRPRSRPGTCASLNIQAIESNQDQSFPIPPAASASIPLGSLVAGEQLHPLASSRGFQLGSNQENWLKNISYTGHTTPIPLLLPVLYKLLTHLL